MATRGMMAESNFVGKAVLLNWLNTTLAMKLEKIEDTCNGAVACQIMDCLHPGCVNIKKVDFNVKVSVDFVGNYKELQQAFTRAGVSKEFNVPALSKGKFQDNNEFMQWLKGYWDEVTGGQEITDYDAVARRCQSKTGDCKKFSLAGGAPAKASSATIPAIRRTTNGGSSTSAQQRSASKAPLPKSSSVKPSAVPDNTQYNSQLAELSDQITELKLKVETVERERDFYFDKLRDIEILCQAPELQTMPIVKIFERILYAADAEEARACMAEAQQQFGAEIPLEDAIAQDLSLEAQ